MRSPVSVVIPCYDCADTVERAVQSVIRQTVRPKEIILVDDASPDHGKTRSVLQSLQKAYSREVSIQLITLDQNGGPGSARNRAWESATQPYLAFLDADDAWHPRKLEIQYAMMGDDPEVSISGHATFFAHAAKQFDELPAQWERVKVTPRQLLLRNLLPTRTVLLKRDIPFRFYEGKRYSEDYHLWLRLVLSGYVAYRLELPLACSFKHDVGAGGLSQRLWKTEMGELDTYTKLLKSGLLAPWIYPGIVGLSLIKFGVRVANKLFSRKAMGSIQSVQRLLSGALSLLLLSQCI